MSELTSLRGMEVLLIEGASLVTELQHYFLKQLRLRRVVTLNRIPSDLVGYMDEQELSSAIVHCESESDIGQIITTHQNPRKNIAVIKRNPPTIVDIPIYTQLEALGVYTLNKEYSPVPYVQALLYLISQGSSQSDII